MGDGSVFAVVVVGVKNEIVHGFTSFNEAERSWWREGEVDDDDSLQSRLAQQDFLFVYTLV